MFHSVERELNICEKENDELFISLVKDRPCLFDKTCIDYKDSVVVENSWIEISAIMHESVDDCKKRWQKLKNNYQKEIENQEKENRSGSGVSKRKKWPLFDNMRSIFSKNTCRPTISNLVSEHKQTVDPSQTKPSQSNVQFIRKKPDFMMQTFQKAESTLTSLMSKVEEIVDKKKPLTVHNTLANQQDQLSQSNIHDLDNLIGCVTAAKLHLLSPVDAKKRRKEITRFLANFDSESDEEL